MGQVVQKDEIVALRITPEQLVAQPGQQEIVPSDTAPVQPAAPSGELFKIVTRDAPEDPQHCFASTIEPVSVADAIAVLSIPGRSPCGTPFISLTNNVNLGTEGALVLLSELRSNSLSLGDLRAMQGSTPPATPLPDSQSAKRPFFKIVTVDGLPHNGKPTCLIKSVTPMSLADATGMVNATSRTPSCQRLFVYDFALELNRYYLLSEMQREEETPQTLQNGRP